MKGLSVPTLASIIVGNAEASKIELSLLEEQGTNDYGISII
jgi:hypothetical protein